MREGRLDISIDGPVATLSIDNPDRRNAMSMAMYEAMPAALGQVSANPDVRVLVLRGAGERWFGAGSDIAEFPHRRLGDDSSEYDRAEHSAWDALATLPLPVLACIHGVCMGGAIALAIHADVRIAADDVRLAVPPARLGVAYPSAAVAALTRLVGPGRAKRLLFTAEVVDAETSLAIGLVDEVVPKSDLDSHVRVVANRIAQLAPLSHLASKVAVDHHSGGRTDPEAVEGAIRACYHSDDFREGIAAFLEKREPEFGGR